MVYHDVFSTSSTARGDTSTHDTVIANHEYTQTMWYIFYLPTRKEIALAGIRTRDPDHKSRTKIDALDHSAMDPL